MRYISPKYEYIEVETVDVITASISNNGQGSAENKNGEVVQGSKGTFSGRFDEIF